MLQITLKKKLGELILWKYKTLFLYTKNKSKPFKAEYFIWLLDNIIARGRISFYYFFVGTWYTPPDYAQLFIILFKDSIIKEKLPLFFILMSHIYEELYYKIFVSVFEILSQNYICELPLKSITADTEFGLINVIKSVFIGINRIGCCYHLKANLDSFAKSIH